MLYIIFSFYLCLQKYTGQEYITVTPHDLLCSFSSFLFRSEPRHPLPKEHRYQAFCRCHFQINTRAFKYIFKTYSTSDYCPYGRYTAKFQDYLPKRHTSWNAPREYIHLGVSIVHGFDVSVSIIQTVIDPHSGNTVFPGFIQSSTSMVSSIVMTRFIFPGTLKISHLLLSTVVSRKNWFILSARTDR